MQESDDNEVMDYSIKLVITKLLMLDDDHDKEFDGVEILLTFDKHVLKIEKISNECGYENVNIGREIKFHLTAEDFSRKLKTSPFVLSLYRECEDLGMIKLEIDWFGDAVLCDNFSSEKSLCGYKIFNNDVPNAEIEIFIEISRLNVFASSKRHLNFDYLHTDDYTSFDGDDINLTSTTFNDDDVSTNLWCQEGDEEEGEEEEEEELEDRHETTTYPASTKSTKCNSDIATSLELSSFSDKQKIYCQDCGGFSISGYTCENKKLFKGLDEISSKSSSPSKHPKSVNRICSECFEDLDLTVLSKDVPCPICARKLLEKPQNKDMKVSSEFVISMIHDVLNKEVEKFKKNINKTQEKKKVYPYLNGNIKLKAKLMKKRISKNRDKNEISKIYRRCSKVKKARKLSKRRTGLRLKHHGIVLGHKNYSDESLNVPKDMGWLWNVDGKEENRRGWKPGAIRKSVAKLMEHFLKPNEIECPPAEPNVLPQVIPKSTLKVERNCGEYTIIMNPQNKSVVDCQPPIIFKITKSDEAKRRSEVRKVMIDRGIVKKCECSKIDECNCMSNEEKNQLLCDLKKISQEFCLCREMRFDELNESSESEMNFEFTPPCVMKSKERKMKHGCTQYEEQTVEKIDDEKTEEEYKKMRKFGILKVDPKKDTKFNVDAKKPVGNTGKNIEKNDNTKNNHEAIEIARKSFIKSNKSGKKSVGVNQKEVKSVKEDKAAQKKDIKSQMSSKKIDQKSVKIVKGEKEEAKEVKKNLVKQFRRQKASLLLKEFDCNNQEINQCYDQFGISTICNPKRICTQNYSCFPQCHYQRKC